MIHSQQTLSTIVLLALARVSFVLAEGPVSEHDAGIIPISIVGSATVVGILLTIWWSKKNNQAFQAKCKEAEEKVMSDLSKPAKGKSEVVDFTFGSYKAAYTDSSHTNGLKVLDSKGSLVFEKTQDGNYRTISGNGKDGDGPFKILEGKIALNTGRAYWIQKSFKGRQRTVLVTGGFSEDPTNHNGLMFAGRTLSTGSAGRFQRFNVVQDEPSNLMV